MKTAIILHGRPSKSEYLNPKIPSPSNAHWFPWLQKQLLQKGILAQTPELPEPFEPNYEKWAKVFERFEINEETILIGHSRGGGFLVRWLSENKIKVGKVALVAPSLRPRANSKIEFDNYDIDKNIVQRTKKLAIFYSDNDSRVILESVNRLQKELKNPKLIMLKGMGHFTLNSMGTEKFPELLNFLNT